MAKRFDADPQTLDRMRGNWQVYARLGPGDGSTVVMNEDGSISAVGGASRNLLINGSFDIWQRQPTGVTLAATGFVTDRFRTQFAWAAGLSVAVAPDTGSVPSTLSKRSCKITVNSTARAPAAGDFLQMVQAIEGNVFRRAIDQPLTISFWIYSAIAATYCLSVRNQRANRSYVSNISVTAGTWQFKRVTIPVDVGQLWYADENAAALVTLCLSANAAGTFSTAADAWVAGGYVNTPQQSNLCGVAAGTLVRLAEFQAEVGEVATEFDYRNVGRELQLCQRYFCKSYDSQAALNSNTAWTGVMAVGLGGAGITYFGTQRFPVVMRSSPTITIYNPQTGLSGLWRNASNTSDSGVVTVAGVSDTVLVLGGVGVAGDVLGHLMITHYAAESEI